MSGKNEISEKQRIFINEYLKDLNGKQAAIRAGYSVKSAKVTASRMLTNDNLRNELSKRLKEIYDNYKNDQEKIIRELAVVGFSRMTNYMTVHKEGIRIKDSDEIPEELIGALSEITIAETKKSKRKSIKLHNKIEALKLLGNYHRLFDDNLSKPIEVNVKVKRVKEF
ncbi:MAG: terminase small subunit [Bacteroidota bacterium]